MGLFDKFKKTKEEQQNTFINETPVEETTLPESEELFEITNNGYLDTTNPEAIAKFKHNLQLLYKDVIQKGRISKFVTIREDDYFPYDSEWIVSSNQTLVEPVNNLLSLRLRERLAIKKAGLKTQYGNIKVSPKEEILNKALEQVDKNIAEIYMPAHFRSTKHFTVNTPLSATSTYNFVTADRNFIIIDDLTNLLNSGYAYSIAPHDAYLDVSHEPFQISDKAVILIEQNKYENLKGNNNIMQELADKKVIIYKGPEYMAINMVLTEMGIIPSKVGPIYLHDPQQITYQTTEKMLQEIAEKYKISYDQSHGKSVDSNQNGHFTSYYDNLNPDWDNAMKDFIDYLQLRFLQIKGILNPTSIKNPEIVDKVIDTVGEEELIAAIQEYNIYTKQATENSRKRYIQQRRQISPEVSEIFKKTVKKIDSFYKNKEYESYTPEEFAALKEDIRLFFQAPKMEIQLQKAASILKRMRNKTRNEIDEILNELEFNQPVQDEKGYNL